MKDNIHEITKKSSLFFIGKLCDAVVMFVFNVLAARALEPVAYGTYVYLFTFVMLIAIFVKVGMDQGLSGILPRYKDKEIARHSISFSIFLVLGLSILLISLVVLSSKFIAINLLNGAGYRQYLIKFIPMLLLLPLSQLSEGIFRTIGGIRYFVIAKNIIVPFGMVLAFLFQVVILRNKSIESALYSNYFAWILSIIYTLIMIYKLGYLTVPSFKYKAVYKKILLLSMPLIFVGLLDYLIGRIDAYMIGYMAGDKSVGIYNISDKVAYISSFLLIAVSSMIAPHISKLYHSRDDTSLRELYQKLTRWVLIVNVGIFFIILLSSGEILEIFGREFASGSWILSTLAFAYLINASAGPVIYMNAMTGNERSELYIGLGMLLSNILLNILWINAWGVVGAAYSTVVVFLLGIIVRVSLLRKNLKIHPFTGRYFAVFGSGIITYAVMLGISYWINLEHFLVKILAYSVIYMLLYLALIWACAINQAEKMQIKQMIVSMKRGD